MRHFSIQHPNPPDDRHSRLHDLLLAEILTIHYQEIASHHGDVESYVQAESALSAWLDRAISLPQRLRLYFTVGNGRAAIGDYPTALRRYDDALITARALDDFEDMAYLLYLRGAVNRALGRFADAAADLLDALTFFEHRKIAATDDARFQLGVHSRLACYVPFLSRHAQAQQIADTARALLPIVPNAQIEKATLDWAQALIFEAQDRPEDAWRYANSAAATYFEMGNLPSAARIQTMAANAAIALAQRSSQRQAEYWQQNASRLLAFGRDLASEGSEVISWCLNRLAEIRLNRLQHPADSERRRHQIKRVAKAAGQLGDDATIAQAFTELGDELAAAGVQPEASRYWYRQAIGVLDGSQMPALALPAKRKLWLAGEMEV